MRPTFLKAIFRTAALAGAGVLLSAGVSSAAAVDVYLQAQSTSTTLPGLVDPVPMWRFVCTPGESNPNCDGSPPRINVAAGDDLTIHLTNTLPVPVSIVIPGQVQSLGGPPVPFSDTRGRDRVRSFTHETAAGATTPVLYRWDSLRPGTYLYQSATHPSIQVPMGLFGALVVVEGPSEAYPGVVYDADAVLLFSEIDPWQNERVADVALGGPPTTTCEKLADWVPGSTADYPCTVDYNPTYFLINGEPYDKTTPPAALPAGAPGNSVLLRLLNAGLRSHTPAIVGLDVDLVAEDGNPYPGLLKRQASALLPAGKTLDVLVAMPAVNATYPLFDRMLDLSNDNQPDGGMLAYLQVGTVSGPPSPTTPLAMDDTYSVTEDMALVESAPGVLWNDDETLSNPTVVSQPSNGTLVLNGDGSFTYTPNLHFSGADGFTYSASDGTNSYGAKVTLNVSFENNTPVAVEDAYVNTVGGFIAVAAPGVLGNDMDADGDTLTAHLATGLGVALNADGSFTYSGSNTSFTYSASDDGGTTLSAPVTVTLTVNPASGIALTVKEPGVGGALITDYRWLVQENRTYIIDPTAAPGTPENPAPADTLSTNFHRSYMPVVAQGCNGCTPDVDNEPFDSVETPFPGEEDIDQNGNGVFDSNIPFDQAALDPTKHYYVSVLPNDAGTGEGHTIGGAPIPPGTTAVTVIVNNQEIPTAQVSVLVFEDNSPTNGAPDPIEPRLGGFQIVLEDAGGRYGISGGTMSQDAFGNPLKNSIDCFGTPPPMGVILTCPSTEANIASGVAGTALIKDLPPAKYGVIAVAPAGETGWTQTSTIEGTKVIDAWVKAGEPPFFAEFGVASFHTFFGFVNPAHLVNPGGGNIVTGRVTMLHPARAPSAQAFDSGSYEIPLAHTRAWVGINSNAGGGPNIQTVQAGPDGDFTLTDIPNGTHQLVIWDAYLDQIIHFQTVILPGGGTVGNIPVPTWFGRHEHNVFLDSNGDGIRQTDEGPLQEQAVNLRFRDGTVFQSFPTDTTGFVPFDQIFPFGSWQVAEVDYTRFKATGLKVTVDGGGDVIGQPAPYTNLLHPQDGSPRLDPGPVLTQGFQSLAGMTSIFEWGKKPYEPGENGGISGIVFYGSTRGEGDPRLTVGDPWEPGIPGVKVRLYREVETSSGGTALALVQETETDSWDADPPTGCEGEPLSGDPFVDDTLAGDRTRCFDGVRNWEQVRPAVFDGGYAFNDIPAGKYVVEVVPPPGYELIKEEDVNVGFGDSFGNGGPFTPVSVILPNGALVIVMPDPAMVQAAMGPEPGLAQPPCVGRWHVVPSELSLFPGMDAPFAGAARPLCDRKEVILSDQGQAAADFHLFTSTPVAGQFQGLTTDDIAIETNPASPSFGDKWGPAFMPISMRDFKGQEVYRTYSDAFGRYNGVLPSTFTANIPIPSGYSPAMHLVCLNDPTLPDGGLDPLRNPNYGTFCYTLQYMPGTTTYLDTPLIPQAAFAAGFNSVDCAPPDGTPVIALVDVQGGDFGPLVPTTGGTLVIQSMGQNAEVPNPAYEGPLATAPYNQPTITRDLGFGAGGPGGSTQGTVTLGGTPLAITQWNANQIRATVPPGLTGGQLVVTRYNGNFSVNAVTVTVSDETPVRVSPGPGAIQAAIDAADPGSLILVEAGTYDELVVLWKPVRLQGSGAATIINALRLPTEKLETWRQKVKGLVDNFSVDLLPGQPAGDFDLVAGGLFGTELGAGITVLAKDDGSWNATNAPRIDGFTITGADGGGGIFVNGYAHHLEIANNSVTGNVGNLHGGIRVGHPYLPVPVGPGGPFAYNTHVNIHHNAITLNGARSFTAVGGGLSLSRGTDDYTVSRNYVCGNLSLGDGAGIGHLGLSDNGRIEFNQILFNQSFNTQATRSGGGIMIAGEPSAAGPTLGAGNVTVDANLIQGNQAGSGHGAGIRTQGVNGMDVGAIPWTVMVTNNMIVNNVAGWSGAGISLQDTVYASIINNTIANNDSTSTVGALVAANASTPQPAGISAERHSPGLAAFLATLAAIPALPEPAPNLEFSDPTLVNNIVWHNRTFTYDATTGAARLLPALTPSTVGHCAAGADYWDLGVLGEPRMGPALQLNPTYSILTSTMGYPGDNFSADPMFLSEYCNGARTLSTPGPLQVAAEVTEGGNFIDVRYGPLTQAWPAGGAPWNYHIGTGSSALNNGNNAAAPNHDFDNQARPQEGTVERGADEVPPPPPGTVAFTSATLGTLSGGTLDFGNRSGSFSSTVTVTVGGGTAVTFGTATVTNDSPAAYSKGADNCSSATVNPGGTCTITVNFDAPGGNNLRTGTLTVPHDGSGSPAVLNLTGR